MTVPGPHETVAQPSKPSSLSNRLLASSTRIRFKVTNGKRVFLQGDGNAPWARRQRDLIAMYAQDLGGLDYLSAGKLSLCHRAATLQVELESAEGRLSLGEAIDLDQYGRLAGHLRRILESIGLDRVAKDVTPTLENYLGAKNPEAAE